MANLSNADLLRRVEELEAENRELRELELELVHPVSSVPADVEPVRKGRGWGWTLFAVVLITLGSLLAPVAVVASWARVALTDTDRFVSAYAPLADDPEIQAYITDTTIDVINDQIDIAQITDDVIEGITELGTGPAATQALELLKGPAASGVESLIRSGVTTFVASDAFADVWESALRLSHAQLVALMENDPDAAIAIGSSGEIGIQLGPIVDAVKTALVDQGIDLANQIPDVDRTIVVAQSDALPSAQLAYGLALAAGTWLPWIAILLLAAGVLVARRRSVALIWAAVGLAAAMLLTLVALAVGNLALVASISPSLVPSGVAGLLYETVAADMRATAIAVLVLAVAVAVVGWLAGSFDVPRRLRGFAREGAARTRSAAERRGITTGRTGEWIYLRRGVLRAAIAVVGAAIVLFVRPVTVGLTLWTLVLAALALAILELVQRPVATIPAHAEDDVPVTIAE
ncbi:hypothetical protein GCM10027413_23300 [Conyzicola nivalis]|uniref:Integral membrane protein n=1 Tax=Conyzicola nivalis TaxID=1477021 RepID=A0A916SB02_9MICO|nr:hypothetical protein [Conyzicola nivalis]GGA91971.1 hypothetical protein GCM10010979_03320 [Conyzicola nivalis]